MARGNPNVTRGCQLLLESVNWDVRENARINPFTGKPHGERRALGMTEAEATVATRHLRAHAQRVSPRRATPDSPFTQSIELSLPDGGSTEVLCDRPKKRGSPIDIVGCDRLGLVPGVMSRMLVDLVFALGHDAELYLHDVEGRTYAAFTDAQEKWLKKMLEMDGGMWARPEVRDASRAAGWRLESPRDLAIALAPWGDGRRAARDYPWDELA